MKISTIIVCLFLLSTGIKSQGLAPSTVRQVFSLQRGDSLEYHTTTVTVSPGCGTLCNIYRLNIIDSIYYNSGQDSLFIGFSSQIFHKDTLATPPSDFCGSCQTYFMVDDYYVITSGLWIVTNLDSNIKWAMDTIYGTSRGFSRDSSFVALPEYNGSKQNNYGYDYMDMSSFGEKYVDSLGIVYKTEFDQTSTTYTEQLIYYHKANGSSWGTPFISTGIGNISEEYPVSVYPNPAQGRFIVKTDLYQGAGLELYDVLSKEIISVELTGKETEINSTGLAPGYTIGN